MQSRQLYALFELRESAAHFKKVVKNVKNPTDRMSAYPAIVQLLTYSRKLRCVYLEGLGGDYILKDYREIYLCGRLPLFVKSQEKVLTRHQCA